MKKLLLPLILLLVGTGAGVGAGIMLKPPPAPPAEMAEADPNCLPGAEPMTASTPETLEPAPETDADGQPIEPEYAKLNNQFVVPIIEQDTMVAMIVLSIGIEVPPGGKEAVFEAEPRLRDKMLQVLFDHANVGGFSGNFTSANNMRILREDLLSSARAVLGADARDVLVLDILRQDA